MRIKEEERQEDKGAMADSLEILHFFACIIFRNKGEHFTLLSILISS